MRGDVVGVPQGGMAGGQRDGLLGNRDFMQPTPARDPFDTVPIPVAGGEIHLQVSARGVLAQGGIHHAHALDELAPVHHSQETQAADAVAHRDLVRAFEVLDLDHLFDGLVAVSQPLLDPCHGNARAEL